jgi:hypothetical protein
MYRSTGEQLEGDPGIAFRRLRLHVPIKDVQLRSYYIDKLRSQKETVDRDYSIADILLI